MALDSETHDRRWIARGLEALSFRWMLVLAIGMGIAPWPAGPMPHLAEKIGMLVDGTLTRPIDIFDLFAHGTPSLLLLAKLLYGLWRGEREADRPD